MTDVEITEALIEADRARSQAEARELALLGEFDARRCFAVDGFVGSAPWLARHLDMTRADAGSMVSDARKLRRHPESLAACSRIGTAKVREFLRRVNHRTEDDYRDMEPNLIEQMDRLPVEDVIKIARRWRELIDADGAEPPEEVPSVTYGSTGGGVFGRFSLFGDDAAFFEGLLDKESDRIFRSEGETKMPAGQRRAQALLNLLHQADGVDDGSGPGRPTVVVHVPVEFLLGLTDRVCEIDPSGTPISAEAARRLMCDADLHRFVTGKGGVPIELGRTERLVTSWQRLALISRDRHCTFPGCERPASYCHAHHIIHWTDGGSTDMANLALLCHHHHHLVHEGGFKLRRLPSGHLEFRRPNGTLLEAAPAMGP